MLLWQDREVRFDIEPEELKERPGEEILATFNPVEDTKGNNGMRGILKISNLRVIWVTPRTSSLNLSIGFKSVVDVTKKNTQSKLRGVITALHITARGPSTRYEFIFTCVEPKNPEGTSNVRDSRLFDTIQKILFAYRTSMFYREVNLRSVLFEKNNFKLLDHERVYQEVPGVWNLSADQGNLGSFIFTTVRLIWYAENNRMHNVSMPWCQMEVVKISPSKFGVAFVVKSTPASGKYTLGFRIDPEEKMREVAKQAAQLFKAHIAAPEFGVREQKVKQTNLSEGTFDEDVEITKSTLDPRLIYGSAEEIEETEFNEDLGLLFQKLPDGVTLEDLWEFKD
ncbi:Oidioi.mRNA.OKI2018_I69.chr1.g3180.t1.cds [Oikopleura dioica]|uniref:Oidioi.mRNA.OKI2018_I69.chr1.g3180.t1.cds n=1 Tax=Oikopleura dioica TaxID=34765 RepID=A0ABN7T069_OIKDI|nr:Oidioi.mRNA.OKI2018_I69.chr1.g3180.t1.cds [Oikopleura dioica]